MEWRRALEKVGVMSAAGNLKIVLVDDDGEVITDKVAISRGWIHTAKNPLGNISLYFFEDEIHEDECVADCSPYESVIVEGEGVI